MTDTELLQEINKMVGEPSERPWIEFKHNNSDGQVIGQTLSALSNMAAYSDLPYGYCVLGVEDHTHAILGTSLKRESLKRGGQDLGLWFQQMLYPRPDLEIREIDHPNCPSGTQLIVFKIRAAHGQPLEFQNIPWGRVGSNNTKLSNLPHVASKIWSANRQASHFENEDALSGLTWEEVKKLIDINHYFTAARISIPGSEESYKKILAAKGILKFDGRYYNITNLGALTLAYDILSFPTISDRRIRIIWYDGTDKLASPKEDWGTKGYALGLDGLIEYLLERLPKRIEFLLAQRQVIPVYPKIVLRELIPNAMIHQDFNVAGGRPTISIYTNRIEIENPGNPILDPDRFIDQDVTRNQRLSSLMREMHYCEQHGSGTDRVLMAITMNHLPPPRWSVGEDRTTATIIGPKDFADMDRADKIRGCYQHTVIQWLKLEKTTNTTVRERFRLDKNQYQVASGIIADAIDAGKIKEAEGITSRRYMSYVPIWA